MRRSQIRWLRAHGAQGQVEGSIAPVSRSPFWLLGVRGSIPAALPTVPTLAAGATTLDVPGFAVVTIALFDAAAAAARLAAPVDSGAPSHIDKPAHPISLVGR
jgi:hypothetical protein